MKFFELMKASELSLHEIVFLSDVSGDDRVFSIKDVPAFALGEILSITEKSEELILEIRSDGGIYEVSSYGWHKFAVYEPDKIPARNLTIGDQVLLRARHSLPEKFSANALPMTCVSEVVEILELRNAVYEVKFKIAKPLSARIFIGSMQLPFGSRPMKEISMLLPAGAPVELAHERLL